MKVGNIMIARAGNGLPEQFDFVSRPRPRSPEETGVRIATDQTPTGGTQVADSLGRIIGPPE